MLTDTELGRQASMAVPKRARHSSGHLQALSLLPTLVGCHQTGCTDIRTAGLKGALWLPFCREREFGPTADINDCGVGLKDHEDMLFLNSTNTQSQITGVATVGHAGNRFDIA